MKSASVTVDGQLISTIGKGILVFAAVGKDDTQKEVESMASKILKVKLWDDDEGKKWKRNVQEIEGEVLCGLSIFSSDKKCSDSLQGSASPSYSRLIRVTVSQFTLLASTKKGNKPDFHKSAGPNQARELYDRFFSKVQALYKTERVKNGVFQAMMDVGLVNDGPVGVDYTCEDGAVKRPACFPFLSLVYLIEQMTDGASAGNNRNQHGSTPDGQSHAF